MRGVFALRPGRLAIVLLLAVLLGAPGALGLAPRPGAPSPPRALPAPTGPSVVHPAITPAGGSSGVDVGASVLATLATLSQPSQATPDLADGDLYVPNFGAPNLGGNTIDIYGAVNHTLLANDATGDDPINSVYDPADQDVYVLDYGVTTNLTVLHGLKVIAGITTGVAPDFAVYDPANQYLYVTDSGSNNVSVVSGLSVVASVTTGLDPAEPAYDPVNGFVYVPNLASGTVTIINGTSVTATVAVQSQPQSATFDPANGWVYVADSLTDNVSVLNGTSSIAILPAGILPSFGAYDPVDQCVYVTDEGSNSVDVYHDKTLLVNLSVGQLPRQVAFDPADGNIYVDEWTSNDVAVLNQTSVEAFVDVGINPYTVAYDPITQTIDSVDFNSDNVTIIGSPPNATNVTVNALGLPAETEWLFDWGPTAYRTIWTSLTFASARGTFAYSTPPLAGYRAVNGSGNATISTTPLVLNITFVPAYPIYFNETGLVGYPIWEVVLPNRNLTGTGASLEYAEPNGTYAYTVPAVDGYEAVTGGNVSVDGGPVTVNLTFLPVPFPVWFVETGLPSGYRWGITQDGRAVNSTNSSIELLRPDGFYSFRALPLSGYTTSNPGGNFSVDNAAQEILLPYNRSFTLTFEAEGLPVGSPWSVRIGSVTNDTTGDLLTLQEPNGTYTYHPATTQAGYSAENAAGELDVAGFSPAIPVPFVAVPVNGTPDEVEFSETGLPGGTLWSVRVGENSTEGRTTTLALWLPAGLYPFGASAVGYAATPGAGNLALLQATLSVAVRFEPSTLPTFPVEFTAPGIPVGTPWALSVDAQNLSGSGGSPISVSLSDGTYLFVVGYVRGFVTPRFGNVTVDGGPVNVTVPFRPALFAVTFYEEGLSVGTNWSVTASSGANGTATNASTGTTLTLWVANGSYSFSAGRVSGYPTPAGGSFSVSGSSPPLLSVSYLSHSSSSASPLLAEGIGLGLVVVGVLLAVAVYVARSRSGPKGGAELVRSGPPSPEEPAPPSPPDDPGGR